MNDSNRLLSLRSDVRLTPLSSERAESMYRWMQDASVRENVGLRTEPSLERTLAWIAAAENNSAMRAYAIVADGQHVGNVVLDKLDSYLKSARLSMYIGEKTSRGKGLGVTAAYMAAAKGFGELSLNKLWLTVHVHNYSAMNVYSKLGFTVEGIHREEFILEGRPVSVFYMGLLKKEFQDMPVQWVSEDA